MCNNNITYKDKALTWLDRKSTRLNSSHSQISYAVFCLKKKKKIYSQYQDKKLIHIINCIDYVILVNTFSLSRRSVYIYLLCLDKRRYIVSAYTDLALHLPSLPYVIYRDRWLLSLSSTTYSKHDTQTIHRTVYINTLQQ